MTFKQHAMGSGMSAGAAGALIGGVNTTVTAAGTTRSDATLLPITSVCVIATGSANQGVILPPGNGTGDGMQPGDNMDIANFTGATILLYPPAGGKLNNGTVNASLSLTDKKVVRVRSIDGLSFIYNLTA